MKIILLRHGKPEFDLFAESKTKYAPAQFREIITRYTESPLNPDTPPPTATLQLSRDCNAIVCSDLIRSLESARMLGRDDIHLVDPVFRESDPPYADWRFPRLSLYSWLVTFRLLWLFGYSNNGESIKAARQRAGTASKILASIAEEHDSVLLAGHGFMNRFIAGHLRANGWSGPKDPGKDYWAYAVYTY